MDKHISQLNTQKQKKKLNDKILETKNIVSKKDISLKDEGGPKGPEHTRYGDWEKAGRCSDF